MQKLQLFKTICMAISIATFIGCSSPNEEITATSTQEQTEDPAVKSISLELKEHEDLSAEKRIELYKKLKAKQPDGYNFNDENELNRYGYELLWDNKTEDAIAILELNKAEFPTSSNVYDSMGDAYFAAEELDSALANYRRSLKLDPFNYNAIDQVLLIDNIKSTGNFDLLKNPELVIRHVDHSYDLVMPAQEYKDDLAQLADVLLAIHPAATKFSSKEEILAIVAAKQALITDSTIYAEFLWHCQEIIASIGCSHTSSGSFYQTSAFVPLDRRFPVQTRWVKNELYIVDDLKNENDIVVGSQIESINGVEVSKIMVDIYNHITTQAGIESTKNRFFNKWSSTLLAFSLGMPKSYQLKLKNHDGIYTLNNPKRFGPFSDPTIELCQNDLCLEIIDTTTARLTVSSFVYYKWNNYDVFTQFIDSSFAELNRLDIQNLIVDVRFNGGGAPEASIYLLRYLMDHPFEYYSQVTWDEDTKKVHSPFANRFDGKLYFIIDGWGESTTGHFMAMVKEHELGIIVGEELGSNQFCTAGRKICRLDNTRLEYYVANNKAVSVAPSLPENRGILPDFEYIQSIGDYFERKDAVLLYTLRLIKDPKC